MASDAERVTVAWLEHEMRAAEHISIHQPDGGMQSSLERVAHLRILLTLAREALDQREREAVFVDQQTPDDCWTACLASLTGLPLESFPKAPDDERLDDVMREGRYVRDVQRFLQGHGWTYASMGRSVPAGYAIASGPSPRRPGFDHSVVVRDGRMVHDPHVSRSGVAGTLRDFEVLIPLYAGEPTPGPEAKAE